MERQIVVTGLGCISPLGIGASSSWNNLLAGKSGISRSATDTTSAITFGGYVGQLPSLPAAITSKFGRLINKPAHMALIAASEAIQDARLLEINKRDRIGISIGTGMTFLPDIVDNYQKLSTGGTRKVSPFFIPNILPNTPGGLIAIQFGLKGPIQSVSSACATGAGSIGEAFLWIKHGMADAVIAGATEAPLNPLSIAGFSQARAMITEAVVAANFDGDVCKASRPFDHRRCGFVMGEGAAMVVLEELQHVLARKAPIYAEIAGYGNTCDSFHITAPASNGDGAIRAMKNALLKTTGQLGYVSAHATSTKLGDSVELAAIEHLANGQSIIVSAPKSAIGHLLGAAGAIEFVFGVKALQTGFAPPTLNFEQFERPIPSNITISSVAQKLNSSQLALCNSFGFGGSNASLAIKRFNL